MFIVQTNEANSVRKASIVTGTIFALIGFSARGRRRNAVET